MPQNESISVLIPIFNEEVNLPPLLEQLLGVMDSVGNPFEIICINDGSTDESQSVLDLMAFRNNNIKIIQLARNFGQTAAIMAGVDRAGGDIIIALDADMQNDPKDIPALLDKLHEGYDLVSGWRRKRKDSAIRRNFLSTVANSIISKVSGLHLHDYGCTLKAYRSSFLKRIKLYGEMHRFIPIYIHWAGGKVTEMEVQHHPRNHGVSKYGMERIFKVIMDLFVIYFMSGFANKPIYFFGALGLGNIFGSFLAAIYAVYRKIYMGDSFIMTPLPMLSIMLLVLGIMFIMMGLIADMQMRTYHESQNKPVYFISKTVNFTDDQD
jgi:glycosyltransferase involved in cell wall biosynthesis